MRGSGLLLAGLAGVALAGCQPARDDLRPSAEEAFALVSAATDRDCERRFPRVERVGENGPYVLWRSEPEGPDVDRYVLAGAEDGCDVVLRQKVPRDGQGDRMTIAPGLFFDTLRVHGEDRSYPPVSRLLPEWRLRHLSSDDLEGALAARIASTCPEPLSEGSVGTDSHPCTQAVEGWFRDHATVVSIYPPGWIGEVLIDVVDSSVYANGTLVR